MTYLTLQSIDAFLRCIEFIATNCKEKDMREIEIDDDVFEAIQAEAIHRALTMSREERHAHAEGLRKIIDATDPGTWIDHQLADIEAQRAG